MQLSSLIYIISRHLPKQNYAKLRNKSSPNLESLLATRAKGLATTIISLERSLTKPFARSLYDNSQWLFE